MAVFSRFGGRNFMQTLSTLAYCKGMNVIVLKIVSRFLTNLEPVLRIKVKHHIWLLQKNNYKLTMPFSKKIDKEFQNRNSKQHREDANN